MEDTPSPQDDRDQTSPRDTRAAFSAPEQPPAKRGSRRAAPPAVTFQPPSVTDSAETPGRPSPKPSGSTGNESTDATAGLESFAGTPAPKARPAKTSRSRKAQPVETPPPNAENVDPTPAQPAADGIQPAKAPPRKRAPRKATPKPVAEAPAQPAAETPARTPAQPAAETPAGTAAATTGPPKTAELGKAAAPQPGATTTASPLLTPEPGPGTAAEPAASLPTKPSPTDPATDPVEPATGELPARHRYTEAWAKLVADPGHAPELLALAAVQTVGPSARDWARRTRDAYPGATDAGLARLATAQFTRFGSLGSVFGAVAGSYASVALLGAAAVTQAELILHLAAAYGLDPTDEERAVDLLVLTRVHPDRATAEEAIARAKQPAYEEGGVTGAAWRLGRIIVAKTGGWTAVRLANRFFPGASLVAATLSMRAATETVAHRANAFYHRAGQQ